MIVVYTFLDGSIHETPTKNDPTKVWTPSSKKKWLYNKNLPWLTTDINKKRLYAPYVQFRHLFLRWKYSINTPRMNELIKVCISSSKKQ